MKPDKKGLGLYLSLLTVDENWMVSNICTQTKRKTNKRSKREDNKTSKDLSSDSLPTSTLRALKTVSFGIGVGGSYGA